MSMVPGDVGVVVGWRLLAATPWPAPTGLPFPSAEFQKEAESGGKKKGKFKTMKVLKLRKQA